MGWGSSMRSGGGGKVCCLVRNPGKTNFCGEGSLQPHVHQLLEELPNWRRPRHGLLNSIWKRNHHRMPWNIPDPWCVRKVCAQKAFAFKHLMRPKIVNHLASLFSLRNRNSRTKLFSKAIFRGYFRTFLNTIGAQMITCRKNCFEPLIFELHRITVHLLSFARINFRL